MTLLEHGSTGPIVAGRMADRTGGRHRKPDVEPSIYGDLAILVAVYVVPVLLLALALGAFS